MHDHQFFSVGPHANNAIKFARFAVSRLDARRSVNFRILRLGQHVGFDGAENVGSALELDIKDSLGPARVSIVTRGGFFIGLRISVRNQTDPV